jgi:hypothetical protein
MIRAIKRLRAQLSYEGDVLLRLNQIGTWSAHTTDPSDHQLMACRESADYACLTPEGQSCAERSPARRLAIGTCRRETFGVGVRHNILHPHSWPTRPSLRCAYCTLGLDFNASHVVISAALGQIGVVMPRIRYGQVKAQSVARYLWPTLSLCNKRCFISLSTF